MSDFSELNGGYNSRVKVIAGHSGPIHVAGIPGWSVKPERISISIGYLHEDTKQQSAAAPGKGRRK